MRNYDEDLEDDDIIPALPTILMLLRGDNEIAPILVLDIADNTIRRIGDVESLDDAYTRKENHSKKLAQYCYNFYNWPAMSAPVYLQQMLQNYLDTTWIPTPASLISFLDPEEEEEMIERRHLLKEKYGWPDNFKEEAWKQEVQTIPDLASSTKLR